jgi:hypothetical protein
MKTGGGVTFGLEVVLSQLSGARTPFLPPLPPAASKSERIFTIFPLIESLGKRSLSSSFLFFRRSSIFCLVFCLYNFFV